MLAGLGQVQSVNILVNKARKYQLQTTYRKLYVVLAFFAISYVLTLVSGWIPATAAKCSDEKPYPLSFTIYMCLYVAFGITTFILYFMNYLMDDDKIEELK